MHYTQRMRDLRNDKDLKQKSVAMVLNISQQYYSEYETGKRELPLRYFEKLCKYYNVSADYLLGFTNEYKPLPKK